MDRMARFAKRIGGAHARAGVLASVVRENPLLAAVAGIGFSVSYQTIAGLARAHHMPGPAVLYPIGIDVGILAMIAEALHLIREGRSDFVPRLLAWLLAGFTIYVNVHGSPAGDWVGGGLHVVMPALWVAGLELVRHRRVAETRTDGIPGRRWIAAPFTTAALWLRMQRDGITSYRLALEMEQARLYARDLIRAAPEEYRPERSSLLCKRIRSGRLTEAVRGAVRGSLANDWAPGWEEAVAEWVTTALALPAHLAANLENTRATIAKGAAQGGFVTGLGSMPEASPAAVPEHALEQASGQVPGEPPSMPETRPGVSAKPVTKPALKLAPGRARSMPAERLADHVEVMLEEYADVSVNRVKKDLHVATEKAQQALDIARRRRLSVVRTGTR